MTSNNTRPVRILNEKELASAAGGRARRLNVQVSKGQGATQVYVDDGVNLSTSNPLANNIEVNWY